MYVLLRKVLPVLLLVVSVRLATGQVVTGTYPYGTFDNKGFDTINVGNLNVHFSIPIINKAGRGLPFWYNLSYDNSVWYPATVNGMQTWTPVQAFGWKGDTEIATGYLSYNEVITQVGSGGGRSGTCYYYDYSNWVYHDPFGVSHQFYADTRNNSYPTNCGAQITSASVAAQDGSGYTLNLAGYTQGTIVSANGKQIKVPNVNNGIATATDSNGNRVSADGSGHFTDTTGNIVLTVAGSAPSPHTFIYKDTNGNSQTVSMAYKTYTVQTAFGCSGVGEYGPTSTSLVDSITFPDGSAYHFAYEPTPGVSGNVTGRLASVTLPQGGVTSYTYTGGNNGVVCADGSTSGLTRSISADSGSAASTWSYTRSILGTNLSHTEVVDGLSNHSAYDFVQASNQVTPSATTSAVYYETNRNIYQGAESGTSLLSRQTCYNGQAPSCSTASFTLPISQIDTYESLNGSWQHGSTAKYNTYGLQTDEYDYDFGTTSRGLLLRHEVWTYGGSIASFVTADQVYDGSNNPAGKTTYTPDGSTPTATSGVPQHVAVSGVRGNVTGITQYSSASASISTTATYEDTGDVLTTASPNGQTTYSYDSTHAYMYTATPPTPSSGVALPTTIVTDVNTGLVTSTTDPNGTKTTYTYDSMLRPSEADVYASSGTMVGKTKYNVESPAQAGVLSYQSASTNADTETQLDSYGRPSRVGVANAQSPNSWYEQDTCYDPNGNVGFQSQRYSGPPWSASQAKICSGSGNSYIYDALGRVKSITHADGTNIQYAYQGRTTQVIDENGVSRITQVDGLGRTAAVCELSSNSSMPGSGSPTSCGMDIAGTGFLTNYTYDLANHKTTVTQGSQQRVFQTDWLGRTILTQEPERGQTTYSYAYNSAGIVGLVVTRQRAQANQPSPGVLTTTTTQYDALVRLLSISYNDGTPTRYFTYDQTNIFGGAPSAGASKGRLTMHTVNVDDNWAGMAYGYDAVGNVIASDECLPSGCGNGAKDKWSSYSYDWLGNVLSAGDGAGVTTYYNNYSPANEVGSITSSLTNATNPGTLVSSVSYGANGPLSYQLGNGLGAAVAYDALGRLNGKWVCNGSSQYSCNGGNPVYSSAVNWQGTRALNTNDSAAGQRATYGYDEFNRPTLVAMNSSTTTPSVTLSCSPNPLPQGATATCTAHVPGGTGTVALYEWSTYLWNVSLDDFGNAIFLNIAQGSPVQSIPLTVKYSGDNNYGPASGTATLNVVSGQVTPTVTLNCTPNPVVSPATTACTASVAPGATGSVVFTYNGGNPWTTVNVDGSGNATVGNGFLNAPLGPYTVTASYSGDSHFTAASASTVFTVNSGKTTPTVTLICVPGTIISGQTATCTAHVSGGGTGTVALYEQSIYLWSLPLDDNGNANFDNLAEEASPNRSR